MCNLGNLDRYFWPDAVVSPRVFLAVFIMQCADFQSKTVSGARTLYIVSVLELLCVASSNAEETRDHTILGTYLRSSRVSQSEHFKNSTLPYQSNLFDLNLVRHLVPFNYIQLVFSIINWCLFTKNLKCF
jgi:hypothetical protein